MHMLLRISVCLLLLTAGVLAVTPSFLLGIDYIEWGPGSVSQIAADNTGALYILSDCPIHTPTTLPSCVTKLSVDGQTVLWQNNLGFTAAAMAVDPTGGVYVIPQPTDNQEFYAQFYDVFVEKLTADGSAVLWQTDLGAMRSSSPAVSASLAVDSTGRVFVAGTAADGGEVVRLTPAGAIDTTFSGVPGKPAEVAVDPTGANIAVVSWMGGITNFFVPGSDPGYALARPAPDNVTWTTLTPPQEPFPSGLAVAANGDIVANGLDSTWTFYVERINAAGKTVFSIVVPGTVGGFAGSQGGFALDSNGNAYIAGYSASSAFPVKNSVAPCGSDWLSAIAPDGSILQTTYLPGASYPPIEGSGPILVPLGATGASLAPIITANANSAVFVMVEAGTDFAPTETGPFPPQVSLALYRLSPNSNAQPVQLACVGNAATFSSGPVAPGEIVTLSGIGLGPQQGIPTQATFASPFPTQAGNAEVTFDGTPAPLLWVQDGQINTVVPWSVAGKTTKICVTYNNVPTNCLTYPVAAAAPGVFMVDSYHAAALNQDGSINSATNPAPPNSIVTVYATGLGPINPQPADGALVAATPLPVNTLPLQLGTWTGKGVGDISYVTYGAAYDGPAPDLIAGASQINFLASDVIGVLDAVQLVVQTPSGASYSNFFQIYLAGQ
jgi:uncharacterized protein (TIGR03437 family)